MSMGNRMLVIWFELEPHNNDSIGKALCFFIQLPYYYDVFIIWVRPKTWRNRVGAVALLAPVCICPVGKLNSDFSGSYRLRYPQIIEHRPFEWYLLEFFCILFENTQRLVPRRGVVAFLKLFLTHTHKCKGK